MNLENEFRIRTLEREIDKVRNSINNTDEEKRYKIMTIEYEISSIKSE